MFQCSPASLAAVLKGSELSDAGVCLVAAGVMAATVLLMAVRPSLRALRRLFVALVVGSGIALAVVAAASGVVTYTKLTNENGAVEWLAAAFLLCAWIIGAIATARSALAGRPDPLGLFLTSGFFVAFWREIEWGWYLVYGQEVWWRRCLVRPRAYWDPAYFERFGRKLDVPLPPATLWRIHVITAGTLIVLGTIVLVLLIRHRRRLAVQLRAMHKTPRGWFFLVGMGLFLGAHALGKVLGWYHAELQAANFDHHFLEEPIELWGAMAFLFAMIAAGWTPRPPHLPEEGPRPSADDSREAGQEHSGSHS